MIKNIQALRALAVYLVVLAHSLPTLAMGGIETARLTFGLAGVDVFFVISGFIMVVTTDTRETQPGDFIWHRITRVVPLYWVLTLVVFGVALAAPSLVQATRSNPVELVKSLFFIPFVKSNGMVQPVVFVGWTLNYEMFFYLLFALSLVITARNLRLGCMLAVLIGLSLAGVCFPAPNRIYGFYTNPVMLEFGAGMFLGAIWAKMPASRGWVAAAWAGLTLAAALFALRSAYWPDSHRVVGFGIPAFLIVSSALVLERAGRVVQAGWILLLGNASYSIYLTHFFVTQAGKKAANGLHVHTPLSAIMIALTTAIVLAFVGIAVHRRIEIPLNRLAKNATLWLANRRALRLPAPVS